NLNTTEKLPPELINRQWIVWMSPIGRHLHHEPSTVLGPRLDAPGECVRIRRVVPLHRADPLREHAQVITPQGLLGEALSRHVPVSQRDGCQPWQGKAESIGIVWPQFQWPRLC